MKMKLVYTLEINTGYEKKRYKTLSNAIRAVQETMSFDICLTAKRRRGFWYHPNYDYYRWQERLDRRVKKVMQARYTGILA
jgi:hypothetical protein